MSKLSTFAHEVRRKVIAEAQMSAAGESRKNAAQFIDAAQQSCPELLSLALDNSRRTSKTAQNNACDGAMLVSVCEYE